MGLAVPCTTGLEFDSQFSQLHVATARQRVSLELLNDAAFSERLFNIGN